MKRLLILFALALSLTLVAQAAEISQKTEYGGGYAEITYYASEQEKAEGNALRTEYYSGDTLLASKVYKTLMDGTLRTDNLNAEGTLDGYTLYRMVDGQETTQEYDASERLISSHTSSRDVAINTQNFYDESGALKSSRVVTSAGQNVVRSEDFDKDGTLLGYTLETPGRRDSYDPSGKLLEFMLYFVSEEGPYTETYYNSRGDMVRSTLRTTTPEGITQTVEYDAQHQKTGSTITKPEGNNMVIEFYDAQDNLLKTEQILGSDNH